MRREVVVSFALLLFTTGQLFAQNESSESARDILLWNEYYKLGWHDFNGKRTEDAIGDAGSVVRIKAKPYLVKNKVRYDVVALFLRNKSWASDRSDELLSHEQLHFDIAELYARKIRKKIRELSDRNINDVKIYNAAIQELLEESNDLDRRYDTETLHGALTKKQKAWTERIDQQLRSLENFKKSRSVISAD